MGSKYLTSCTKVDVIWNSSRKVRNFFQFKDRLFKHLRSKPLTPSTQGKLLRTFSLKRALPIRTGKKFKYNPKTSHYSAILHHINTSGKFSGKIESFKIIVVLEMTSL